MSALIIRHANNKDIESLFYLYELFYEYHANMLSDKVSYLDLPQNDEQVYKRIDSILSGESASILIAEKESQIVGCAEILLVKNAAKETKCHLSKLFVIESCRGQGIGTQILEVAHNWALKNGASEIQADVWEFDNGPFNFYQKCGYNISRYLLVKQCVDRTELAK